MDDAPKVEIEDLKPLQRQCAIAIRNGIENGTIRSPHQLPPRLRSCVSDMVLMHGTINQPNCATTLASMEFLDGLTSLDTQHGNQDDTRYLEHVTRSISTTTFGQGIRELKLNVYGCQMCEMRHDGRKGTTLATVLKLVAKCPNLESLSLKAMTRPGKLERCRHEPDQPPIASGVPEFLNDMATEIDDCVAILENLKELHLIGPGVLLRDGKPTIKFKNLTSLTLHGWSVDASAWSEFLVQHQNTLKNLNLKGMRGMSAVLPIAMPGLETLIIRSGHTQDVIDRDFVINLVACSNLKCVELPTVKCNGSFVDQPQAQSTLVSFLSERESKIGLYCQFDHDADDHRRQLDADSNFILVKAFGNMITSLNLAISIWDRRLATAVQHVVAACQNLETFGICVAQIPDTSEFEAALLPLFDNEERALKHHHLELNADFDHALMESIFKYCLNLKTISITNCHRVNDGHPIEWASRGGGAQLRGLSVMNCEKISADGLVPVFLNAADRLRQFSLYRDDFLPSGRRAPYSRREVGRMWDELLKHCRFLEMIESSLKCGRDFTSCHNDMYEITSNPWMYLH